MSTDRAIDKEDVVCIYIHNGILLSHTRNEILPLATTWMYLEGIMLSEINQTEKDKYSAIIYIWNLKNKTMNEYNTTVTDSQILRTN